MSLGTTSNDLNNYTFDLFILWLDLEILMETWHILLTGAEVIAAGFLLPAASVPFIVGGFEIALPIPGKISNRSLVSQATILLNVARLSTFNTRQGC
jgi:hypothetical protein